MNTKYFKNGNISIILDENDRDYISNEIRHGGSLADAVFCVLANSIELNFILADEVTGCAGNYDLYYHVFDAYTGKEYLILASDLINLYNNGGALRLSGHDITEEELKENFSEYYGY